MSPRRGIYRALPNENSLVLRLLRLFEQGCFHGVSNARKRLNCSNEEVYKALDLLKVAGCVVKVKGQWLFKEG